MKVYFSEQHKWMVTAVPRRVARSADEPMTHFMDTVDGMLFRPKLINDDNDRVGIVQVSTRLPPTGIACSRGARVTHKGVAHYVSVRCTRLHSTAIVPACRALSRSKMTTGH